MRKVFLDCGANNGCSVRKFKQMVKNYEDFEIFSFEPNEVFADEIRETGALLIDKAVWIEDGPVDFHVVTVDKYGNTTKKTGASTLNPHKSEWNSKAHREVTTVQVEGLNFSHWVASNFSSQDFIILKMDIEGSEYDVLEKMIEDDSIRLINELWIEFHPHKAKIDAIRHNTLNKYIDCLGIKVDREWNAM